MIPDGWQVQNLADVALIILGQSPPSSACNENVHGYPFYQGNADFGFLHPLPQRWIENPLKVAKKDDILISVRAPVGELNIANTDCCIGRGVGAIRPLTANRNFIYYTLLNARNSLTSVSQGSTFDAINGNELRNLPILIPPLPEQIKIAAILSSVDDTIQATQAVIDQTRRVKQGMLQQILTRGIGHTRFKQTEIGEIPEEWEHTTIGRVTESHSYGPRFSSKNYSENGNVKTIRGTDLTETGEILYKHVPTAMLDEKIVQQHKLLSSDLVVITTADCGRSAIFVEQKMPYIPSAYAVRYRLKKIVSPPYIKLFMQTQSAKTQIDSFIRKGTVANLPGSDVLKIKLPLPPLDEQLKILQIFNSIEFETKQLIEILDSYSKIKYGLMQDLLTGRVRVGGLI